MNKNKASFTIAYAGSQAYGVDVRELVPVLMALSDVLVAANKTLNGDRASIAVNIFPFKDGSFCISIEIVQSILDPIKGLLNASETRDALQILDALGFSFKDVAIGLSGLIGFVIYTKGRKPKNIASKNDGTMNFTFDDNGQLREISVPKDVAALYLSESVRAPLVKVIEPLRKGDDGFDAILLENGKESRELVTSKNVESFENLTRWDSRQDTAVSEQERIFSISSVSFKEGYKWRFSDGENTFNASIMDKEFLKLVEEGLAFRKGDMLKVELRVVFNYGDGKLSIPMKLSKCLT